MGEIVVQAGVVQLADVSPGVAKVTMQDRMNKNTFSEGLVSGLCEAFAQIRGRADLRAVVLTGYDTYFCSGGTQQMLLRLQAGEARFTDSNLYSLPLFCEIPVIAAMQGHGVGGGFAFGLFADVIVLSRESIYVANFMKYGFTPGMGATYVLPKKLGICLAAEMLLTARAYHGSELERRGVPFPVLPRAQVLAHALELGRDLAEKPRAALIALKSHLVAEMRAQLPVFVDRELAMHKQTIHLPEVRDRIERGFRD